MDVEKDPTFALVLSGGGARGAYEAGVIYYLRTRMPKEIAGSTLFKIYCGTSVGAINCAHMASTAADPLYQGAMMKNLWENLRAEHIYNADIRALSGFLVKSGFFMATNFFGLNKILGHPDAEQAFPFRSVLDTTPFLTFMRRNISWYQMHRNIERGLIDAVTISTSHIYTGRLALFVEKHPDVVYSTGGFDPVFCSLSPKHVLASASIPIVFPPIRINRQYYGDGGIRQNTPMSPAIHLGADRLLVITLRSEGGPGATTSPPPKRIEVEPAISNILGLMLNTIFLDKMDYDLDQMRRINYLLKDIQNEFGEDALDRINASRTQNRVANKELTKIRPVIPFVLSSSEDIGHIASEIFNKVVAKRETLNPVHKFFANVVQSEGDNDFISYLFFEPEYLKTLVQLGFEDAQREHDRLVNFFTNQPLNFPPSAPGDPSNFSDPTDSSEGADSGDLVSKEGE